MDSIGLLLICFVVFYYQFSTILGSESISRQLFETLQLISGTQFQYVTLRNVPKVGLIYTFSIPFSVFPHPFAFLVLYCQSENFGLLVVVPEPWSGAATEPPLPPSAQYKLQ